MNRSSAFSRVRFAPRCAIDMVQEFAQADDIVKKPCIQISLDRALGTETERPPSPKQRMKKWTNKGICEKERKME